MIINGHLSNSFWLLHTILHLLESLRRGESHQRIDHQTQEQRNKGGKLEHTI